LEKPLTGKEYDYKGEQRSGYPCCSISDIKAVGAHKKTLWSDESFFELTKMVTPNKKKGQGFDWLQHIPFIGWIDDFCTNRQGHQPKDPEECHRNMPCLIIAVHDHNATEEVKEALNSAVAMKWGANLGCAQEESHQCPPTQQFPPTPPWQ